MMNKVFIDTSYILALSFRTDQYHKEANSISIELEMKNTELFITYAVILEIINTLSRRKYRYIAIELMNYFEKDFNIKIIPFSEDLYKRSRKLYTERPDKEWSLTDCISFVVMEDYGLHQALTADKHFQQAGFQALLLNS